ncbi:unnamed protein product [Caenorhabditis angaria]|uniref:Uncharacterized protein n=1 Tax=Caenorhabditis angaria TaxID=860376 RepID=A0A9P1IF04_9PELO|nr:unnamed protein product [Caenorhabditis angaria]
MENAAAIPAPILTIQRSTEDEPAENAPKSAVKKNQQQQQQQAVGTKNQQWAADQNKRNLSFEKSIGQSSVPSSFAGTRHASEDSRNIRFLHDQEERPRKRNLHKPDWRNVARRLSVNPELLKKHVHGMSFDHDHHQKPIHLSLLSFCTLS